MTDKLIIPTPQQLAWADAEIGVIIHLDLQVFEPSYEFRQAWGYSPDPSVFNPSDLNTDQWIEAAVAAGARYAVLVAKHCSGFSLWPTKAHPYSVASSPWKDGKGDIVADFFRSCRKYGVRPGLYCSLACNAYLNVDNPGLVRDGDPEKQARYNEIALQQLAELWTNYGEVFEIWFDGGVLPPEQGGPDVVSLMRELQPDAIVFQGPSSWPHCVRWCGNELGIAAEPNWSTTDADAFQKGDRSSMGGDPNGDLWASAECDMPNRKASSAFQGGWFWREGDEPFLYSGDELVECYFRSVAQNSNLLIGMVIDNRGRFPDADTKVFQEFGRKLKQVFSAPVASTSGSGHCIALSLPAGARPNVIVLMEDLAQSERVRRYSVEALIGNNWFTIWQGTCIGHKRIERFEPLDAAEIRLNILESVGEPQIREISAWAADEKHFSAPINPAKRCILFIGRNKDGNVSIECSNSNLAIRYTIDGTEPNASSPLYTEPFPLPNGGAVKAFAFVKGGHYRSDTWIATFGACRDRWRIKSTSLDSPYDNNGAADVAKVLDDDPETYWHTYHVDKSKSAPPHEVVIDMGERFEVAAFTFMPRIKSLDGTPDKYEFYLSADSVHWVLAAEGELIDLKENPIIRCIRLDTPQTGRYIRFVAKHVLDDGDYVVVAGIGVITK